MLRLRANNQIRSPQVKVIDENGQQLGVLDTFKALQMAKDRDLDLVEVGPTVSPPIAKIMDYGKYVYQKEKQEKQSKTRQKDQETKTVRVGYKTGEHDLNFKAGKIDEFLQEGHPVKVELTLRGREKGLAHIGKEKLEKFLAMLATPVTRQGSPTRSPYGWVVMIQIDKKAANKLKSHGKDENQQITPEARKDNGVGKGAEAPAEPESL
ncbi:MAG: translation initiation factor IF-3 [Acidobacteria bacterium]|nr:translation initiation factor IF-3 [Acidobacteriota bacterium]